MAINVFDWQLQNCRRKIHVAILLNFPVFYVVCMANFLCVSRFSFDARISIGRILEDINLV